MNILDFFKEFGNLINFAMLASLGGVYAKFQKSRIDLLNERIATMEEFSLPGVVEKFRALKEFYEVQNREWLEMSLKGLREEQARAIEHKQLEWEARIAEEIKERTLLQAAIINGQAGSSTIFGPLTRKQVCGVYTVVGHNPHMQEHSYFGELTIVEDTGSKLAATWTIGSFQDRFDGMGIMSGNQIAFIFRSVNAKEDMNSGLILYEFVNENILRGSWTGFLSVAPSLGYEECRRKGVNEPQVDSK